MSNCEDDSIPRDASRHSSVNPISVIGSYLTMLKFDPNGKTQNAVNGVYLIGRSLKYDAETKAKNEAKKVRRCLRHLTRPN